MVVCNNLITFELSKINYSMAQIIRSILDLHQLRLAGKSPQLWLGSANYHSGIYFVFDSTGALVYIGRSHCIAWRIQNHIYAKKMDLASVSVLFYGGSDISHLELMAIGHHRPKHNRAGNPDYLAARKLSIK